jgi:integrase/recombinase XerD
VLDHIASTSQQPDRDRVIMLLSIKAGLRACEIAGLDWSMLLDDKGRIGHVLTVRDAIAKNGSGRRIPIHPELRKALRLIKPQGVAFGPVVRSARGGAIRPNSLVNWFVALYRTLGLSGCSSHSGRRSFITQAARNLHRAGCSLRDVQLLAGHRSIETTQRYIDGDTDAQRKLVGLL